MEFDPSHPARMDKSIHFHFLKKTSLIIEIHVKHKTTNINASKSKRIVKQKYYTFICIKSIKSNNTGNNIQYLYMLISLLSDRKW